jgi:hypothetical protein
MSFMNFLSREKQIEIIAALCEGVGQRAVTRLTGTDRKTVARLALSVGRGCAELHDRLMVGIRVNRLELARKEADRLACVAWNQRMLGFKGPAQPSPSLGDALNARYLYLEVRCLGCDTRPWR